MFQYYEWLLLAFPIMGALLNGLLGRRFSPRLQSWIACGAIVGSLLVALPIFVGESLEPGLVGQPVPLEWLKVRSGQQVLEGPFALRVDALSIAVTLTAIVAGLFIHVHASLRTRDESARHVTLALLNGTLAALLALVLAGNFYVLLLGWSLTGWCTCSLFRAAPGQKSPRLPSPMSHVISDLCMLLAAAIMSRLFASLTLHDIISMEPATVGEPPPAGATAAATTLLVCAAAIRAGQLPFCAWSPEGNPSYARATAYALTSALPGVYLLARVYPLFRETAAVLALLSWWGAATAFVVAFVTLFQPQLLDWSRLVVAAQAGLMFLALGTGAYSIVFAFLPAYALLHTLLQLMSGQHMPAGPKRGRQAVADARRPPRWMVGFALAAACGVPLLPGFAFHAQLLEALSYGHEALWVLAGPAMLLLAAGGARIAFTLRPGGTGAPSEAGVLFLTAFGIGILGLINLASPPPLARFLEPIFIQTGYQPSWWWFGIAAVIAALGAGLGYLLAPRVSVPWPTSQRVRNLYDAIITRPLLAAGGFVAQAVEPRAASWTFGALARLVDQKTNGKQPSGFVHLSLFFVFLAIAAIVAYLFMR